MISRIKSVSTHRRKFKIDNFFERLKLSENLILKKDAVSEGYGVKKSTYRYPTDAPIVRLFKAGKRLFALNINGALYECKSSAVYISEEYNIDASILEVTVNGKNMLMLASRDTAYFIGGENIENFPQASDMTYYKGRYFIAEYHILNFTGLFDMKTNSANLNVDGKIYFDSTEGEIVGFCPREDGLIVFLTNAIYKLIVEDDGEFKLEKLDFERMEFTMRTLAVSNGVSAFVNGKKLSRLVGDKIVKFDCLLDNLTYSVLGYAELKDGRYYIPIKVTDGGKYLFVFDFVEEAQTLIPLSENGFACGEKVLEDGYIYDVVKTKLPTGQRKLEFLPIDFDDCESKTLCGLNANVSQDCSITIRGDFGKKTYELTSGYNIILLNLTSRDFALEVSASKAFEIYQLEVEYRLKGE